MYTVDTYKYMVLAHPKYEEHRWRRGYNLTFDQDPDCRPAARSLRFFS
jgi:hypothetical protein